MSAYASPADLLAAYDRGLVGCIPDPVDHRRLLAELRRPKFAAAGGRELSGSGRGKLSLPFRSVLKFDPAAYEERQTTGDCVSHAARNAADLARAVEIDVRGESEGWHMRGATEGIYGSRGSAGAGMTCSGAVRFLSKTGGLLLRKAYPFADLTTYRAEFGIGWGRSGLPADLAATAAEHPVRTVSQLDSVEEARDALANGYGLCVCSNVGFSAERDADGFAVPRGTWYHAMAWIACDDLSDRPGFLIQNSWGNWNRGPTRHNQPVGSFWIDYRTASRMIAQQGAFAISNVDGFPPVRLPDYGTAEFLRV